MSNRELAKKSQWLFRSTVDYMSESPSWRAFNVGMMLEFMRLCDFDPLHARRHRSNIRRGSLTHCRGPYARKLLNILINSRKIL